jgi:HSP20 family protein
MPFETPWERHWGIEMEETPTEFVVRAELPGFETNEIEVLLERNLLTIRAEHREVAEEKEPVERPYGRLERTLTLPEAVIAEKIEARYRNGVLEVHLPRTPEAMPRRIAVTT